MLTQEQVDGLPDGTPIRVKWSGSSHFANYILRRSESGSVYAEYRGAFAGFLDYISATNRVLTQVYVDPDEPC